MEYVGENKYFNYIFKKIKYLYILMNGIHSLENHSTDFIDYSNIDFDILCEKSKVYFNDFKNGDLFWGFGIENETYLELVNTIEKKYKDVINNTRRERYSVDYNLNYDLEIRKHEVIENDINNSEKITLPIFLNAYALQTMDLNGQHRTTYEKEPKPNKKFGGKSIIEILREKDNFFVEGYGPGKIYIFDGDTIEFTTRNFYKTTMEQTIQELKDKQQIFMEKYNGVMEKINKNFLIKKHEFNYGFTHFYSNPNHTAIFNNGTYHINITAPIILNKNGIPNDMNKFLAKHIKIGKIIQWFSPLIVACYGSSDIYSLFSNKYAFGSQRITSSRYISIGTFNFDKPLFGKVLQLGKEEVINNVPNFFWLNKIEKHTGYKLGEKIGMDFNMMKHKNLGLEWRIMDMFPYEYLEDFMLMIFLLIDYSINLNIENPIYSKRWNKLVFKCLTEGWSYIPKKKIVKKLDEVFKLDIYNVWLKSENKSIYYYFNILIEKVYYVMEKNGFGDMYKYFVKNQRKPILYNWNRMKWENEIDIFFKKYNNKVIDNINFNEEIYINGPLEMRSLFYLESKGKLKINKFEKNIINIEK